tara:strand:+ start:494 stop:673 length:180 start_codon:yes stop_codon:yes gene_type:complete
MSLVVVEVVHGVRVMVVKVVLEVLVVEDVELTVLVIQAALLLLMVLQTLVEVAVDLERP